MPNQLWNHLLWQEVGVGAREKWLRKSKIAHEHFVKLLVVFLFFFFFLQIIWLAHFPREKRCAYTNIFILLVIITTALVVKIKTRNNHMNPPPPVIPLYSRCSLIFTCILLAFLIFAVRACAHVICDKLNRRCSDRLGTWWNSWRISEWPLWRLYQRGGQPRKTENELTNDRWILTLKLTLNLSLTLTLTLTVH